MPITHLQNKIRQDQARPIQTILPQVLIKVSVYCNCHFTVRENVTIMSIITPQSCYVSNNFFDFA